MKLTTLEQGQPGRLERDFTALIYFIFAIGYVAWVLATYRSIVHMDIMNIIGTKMKNVLEGNLHATDFIYQPLFPALSSLSFTFLNAKLFHLNTVIETIIGSLFLVLLGYKYLKEMCGYLPNGKQRLILAAISGFIIFGLHKWEASFTSFFSFAVFFNLCLCFFNYFFVFRWIDKEQSAKSSTLILFVVTNLLVIFEAPAYFFSYILSVIILLLTIRPGNFMNLNKRRWAALLTVSLSLLLLTVAITSYLSNHPLYSHYTSNISAIDFVRTFFDKPIWIIKFYLITHSGAFLGEAYNALNIRALFGLLVLVSYGWAIYYVIKRKEKKLLVPVALILHNIISCGFITMSRYIFDLEYGASSRYTAFNLSGVLGVTTIFYFIVLETSGKVKRGLAASFLALVFLGYLFVDWRQIRISPSRVAAFEQMKTALLTGENLEILQAKRSNTLSAIKVMKKYRLNVFYGSNNTGTEVIQFDNATEITLTSGDKDFEKLNKVGFYENENGITWTSGNSSILLDKLLKFTDTLIVEMDTYMPPVCKDVSPKIALLDTAGQVYKPALFAREGDNFTYRFNFEKPVVIHKINLYGEVIDASPDLRVLSFPFRSLEIRKAPI